MEREFVPYNQALKLKELGFDEPCFVYYKRSNENKPAYPNHGVIQNSICGNGITAPTFSQVFRWFRDKYNLKSFIQPIPDDVDTYIFAYGTKEIEHDDEDYLKYEEAELACLRKLIEIAKD